MSFFILSNNFFTLDLLKESIEVPDAELYGESFEKNLFEKTQIFHKTFGVTINSHIICFTVVITGVPMSALFL